MNEKEILEFLENMTEEQAEGLMLEFDNNYECDDVGFVAKAETLATQYINANDEGKVIINNVLINLCGYSLTSLVKRSKGILD